MTRLLAFLALLPTVALADIGPRPSCPDGTHNEYLMGNRCVKNGFHLEQSPDGRVQEVADAAPATPVAPEPATPAPATPAAIAEVPASPATPAETQKCATTGDAAAWLGALGLLGLARRRR